MKARTLSALCALGLLVGCGGAEDDLRAWMQQTRSTVPPRPASLPEAKPYEPIDYKALGSVEPFSQRKIGELNRTFTESPDGLRQREPLEAFPLENFQLQGVMRKGSQAHAVMIVDSKAHQVRVGQHIGQNYGRIIRITENEVVLRELVQEGAGEWKERMTTVKMQESR